MHLVWWALILFLVWIPCANGTLDGLGSIYLDGSDTLMIAFKNEQFYVSGIEFSAVPVPAAIWLFGTALIGFIGISRRTNLA